MNIKLGPDWKKVKEMSLTWPTTGTPCKEVFKHLLLNGYFFIYYDEEGRVTSHNGKKFFCDCEIAEMFSNA